MKNTIQPIKPSEIDDDILPDEVIRAVNELIIKNWKNHEAEVYEDEVKKLDSYYSSKNNTYTPLRLFLYLQIIDVYQKNGWSVTYIESSPSDTRAKFIFRK
jgi:hypothetical protein